MIAFLDAATAGVLVTVGRFLTRGMNTNSKHLTWLSAASMSLVTVAILAVDVLADTAVPPVRARATFLRATSGQTAQTLTPQFEVASIKLVNGRGAPSVLATALSGPPGSVFTHRGSVRVLIEQAYEVPMARQIGGPGWIGESNYYITAKIPENVERTPENMRHMVRALLTDRFRLVAREEERDLPIYALVYARADQRPGPAFAPAAPECLAPNNNSDCRMLLGMAPGGGHVQFRNQPFERFVSWLERSVRRPILNRTGITGRYNLEMAYAPNGQTFADASDVPSLYTALQEQLGLKLESDRSSVRVLVIDSVQRPTED
jgi:uncharacterized protein (TIGR03435 family)